MDVKMEMALGSALHTLRNPPENPGLVSQAEHLLAGLVTEFQFGDLRVDIDITSAGTALRLTDTQGDLHAVLDRKSARRFWELLGVVYGFEEGDVAS